MEIEPSPPMIAKKLWNIVRALMYMLRKGISKSKPMFDLHMMLKRGKIASKAIGNLMLHHHYYSTFTCRSNDIHMSFVSPREYEFSCSNSPVHPWRKHHHYRHHHQNFQADDINVVQKVIDVLNNDMVEASPLTLPGFGRSPMVRQLRITDSPFPLKDNEEDTSQVDKAAEEFINKFYKDLKQQKKLAALESPSPYHIWARRRS